MHMNNSGGWTLVLVAPDYLASTYGQDLYIEQVAEPSLTKALRIARHNAWVVYANREPSKSELKDFHLAAAIRGSHEVISGDL